MATDGPPTDDQARDPAPTPPAAAGEERRQAIAATVRREKSLSPREQAEKLVYTWPHLVLIEFIASMLMLLSLILMSWLVNAPLEAHADADRTPNPSKAPWYFLNLQELLLHMHPALAGVVVPSAVVFALLPAIPYIDRDQRDVGKWFGTPKAAPVALFTAVFTTIALILEIIIDELPEWTGGIVGIKPTLTILAKSTGLPFSDIIVTGILVPTILMLGPIPVLLWLLNRRYGALNTREVIIALFTGFVVSYLVLTIVGTFFRGQGMHLYLPTDPRQVRLE